ncbi:MAG: ABC transporter substrate-binding protein, partial [Clostridium sp.]|nr:ABC transporter substrate-binding protein [Clostridium sp.]
MIKKICSVLLGGLLLFNLSGCTSKESSVNKDMVTIKFSWWGTEDRYERTMKVIKLFEEKNPDIKIKPEYGEWTGFAKRMKMKILGNDEADVMQLNYDWLTTYSKDGTGFYDINKVSDEIDLSNFSEDYLSYGRKNGVLNAIPISTNGKIMFYNKQIVEENISTWDDLINSAPKDGTYIVSTGEFDLWSMCMAYEQGKTGKAFISSDGSLGFAKEDIVDLLSFYKTLVDKKIVPLTLAKDGNGEFDKNNAGISVGWTNDAQKVSKNMNKFNTEIEVSAFPSVPGQKPITYVKPTSLYAISKNTEHAKEAARFMNFMLNDTEAAEILGLDRGVPASKASYNTLKDKGILEGVQYDANSIITDTNEVLLSPYYENTQIKNICYEAIEEITYGKSSPQDCAEKTYNDFTKVSKTLIK